MNEHSLDSRLMKERRRFLEEELRQRPREWMEAIIEEELEPALGSRRSQRSRWRRDHREGKRRRTFSTFDGHLTLEVPQGAFFERDRVSGTHESRSRLRPRYARRDIGGRGRAGGE